MCVARVHRPQQAHMDHMKGIQLVVLVHAVYLLGFLFFFSISIYPMFFIFPGLLSCLFYFFSVVFTFL